MPLTCSCDEEPYPGMVIWHHPDDYTILDTTRRQRCCSCSDLIDLGAIIGISHRYKIPDTDLECLIHGEDGEIHRADKYICEECLDLFYSFDELGFCVFAGENQKNLIKEYKALKSGKNLAQ